MTSRLVHNKNFVSIGLSLPPFPELAHHAYRIFLEIFWTYDFLAVQDSSISDIVGLSVCRSLGLSQLTIRA